MAKSKKKKRKYPKPWEPPTEWEVPELDLDEIFSIKNALLTGSEFIEKYALVSGRAYLQDNPNSLSTKDAYRLNEKYVQNLRRLNPYQIKYDTANIIDYRKYKYVKDNKDIATVAEEYFQKHKNDPLRCIAPYFSEAIIYGLDSNNIFYYRMTEMGSDHIDFDIFCMLINSLSQPLRLKRMCIRKHLTNLCLDLSSRNLAHMCIIVSVEMAMNLVSIKNTL